MHDAKTNLSRYLAELRDGETIVVCRRNVPVAEIRQLSPPRRQIAEPGRWQGTIEVPADFSAPLPDELLDAFEGVPGSAE